VNSYYVSSGSLLGLRDAGALSVLLSFVLPVHHFLFSCTRLVLPYLARAGASGGDAAVKKPVRAVCALFMTVGLLYWTLLSVFREQIVHLLYGEKYQEFAHLVPLAALTIVFHAGAFAHELGLRALQDTFAVLKMLMIAATVTIVVGLPAMLMFGLPGALGTMVLTMAINLVSCSILFYRRANRPALMETAA
jgi:O-antigen/teichoic acid export membrane protein